jgi:hypothetical protein
MRMLSTILYSYHVATDVAARRTGAHRPRTTVASSHHRTIAPSPTSPSRLSSRMTYPGCNPWREVSRHNPTPKTGQLQGSQNQTEPKLHAAAMHWMHSMRYETVRCGEPWSDTDTAASYTSADRRQGDGRDAVGVGTGEFAGTPNWAECGAGGARRASSREPQIVSRFGAVGVRARFRAGWGGGRLVWIG